MRKETKKEGGYITIIDNNEMRNEKGREEEIIINVMLRQTFRQNLRRSGSLPCSMEAVWEEKSKMNGHGIMRDQILLYKSHHKGANANTIIIGCIKRDIRQVQNLELSMLGSSTKHLQAFNKECNDIRNSKSVCRFKLIYELKSVLA